MLKVIVRTLLMYILVTIGVRLMGKRQIGDMQPTELVITLLISEIAAIPLQDVSQPVSIGLIAIFMLVFLEIVASIIIMKNLRLRRIFSGKSVVIIKNGVLDQKAMKSVRMTVFDLVEMLRMQGYFELEQIESAILEINGNLSVKPKSSFAPITPNDMKIKTEESGLAMTVISDGTIVDASLKFLNKTRDDLKIMLKKQNLNEKDIFVMTMNESGESIIVKKEKGV